VTALSPRIPEVLHLSIVVPGDLLGAGGGRLGRVEDLIVRLGGDEYPPVSGLVAQVGERQVFIDADQVEELAEGRVMLRTERLDVRSFQRRDNEVLLKKDVLDRQVINVDGARLVRANEIELARIDGWYRVVGVDVSLRGLLRRIVPRPLARRVSLGTFLDWASVEPFTGHVPTVRLRVPHPKLARLHPAELADLVEAASHQEGDEIMAAVAADPELVADVFEELEDQHQLEFAEERTDAQIAELLGRMESDDAADLVLQLPEERREVVVSLLSGAQRRRVRTLLGYDPATAGGLMSPDFVCVFNQATVAEALERVRASRVAADGAAWVFAMNTSHRLRGGLRLADLVRADPQARVSDAVQPVQSLRPDADLEEVARLMTDFDLTVAPVTDEKEQLVGVITVDDVLEVVLPNSWRRRFGVLGGE